MDHPDEFFVSSIEIELSDTQNQLRPDRALLKRLVHDVLKIQEVASASISLALVDNATIREINRRHLDHDWPTDVITFPLSSEGDATLIGEIVVSAEMARDSAAEFGHDPWAELALYVVHGLLHLQGYDDLTEEAALEMRRREGEVLALLGLPNAYSWTEARPRP